MRTLRILIGSTEDEDDDPDDDDDDDDEGLAMICLSSSGKLITHSEIRAFNVCDNNAFPFGSHQYLFGTTVKNR